MLSVLGLTVTALLAGCRSLDTITQFGRDRGNALPFPLRFRHSKTPNKSAPGKMLRCLSVAVLEPALRTRLTTHGTTAGHLAVDSKTLIGRAAGDAPGRRLVAAYATEHAADVGQLDGDCTPKEL